MNDSADAPIKVWLVCTGVGTLTRGIETFARECFDGLRGRPGLNLTLFKGAGAAAPDERVLWNLPRTRRTAHWLGKVVRRNGYVVEQLSSFLPLVRAIRRERPDVIFSSESNLRFQLFRWRHWIGVPYRLLFSNGGPVHPPFVRTDFVQQVAPPYLEEALAAGEAREKHFLVPYGIQVPADAPDVSPSRKRAARAKLGLPLDRPIVLSVGWLSKVHKRTDYIVQEVAALPAPRPFLVLLGHMDAASPPILALASKLLGAAGYTARSVPYAEVADYYTAADLFTLGSLKEGFGRVYLEALIGGLPCVVHDDPVMRYVLGDDAVYGDFTQPGGLARLLGPALAAAPAPALAARRRSAVRARFGWDALAPAYLQMFRACRGR